MSRIDEIKERRAKITDYAVNASRRPLFGRTISCSVENFPTFAAPDSAPVAYVADMADARFYAHAPEDVDCLLAEVERLTGEAEVEAALKELQWMFPESPTHQIIIARGNKAPGLTQYTAAVGALAIWHGPTLADCLAQVRVAKNQLSNSKKG